MQLSKIPEKSKIPWKVEARISGGHFVASVLEMGAEWEDVCNDMQQACPVQIASKVKGRKSSLMSASQHLACHSPVYTLDLYTKS